MMERVTGTPVHQAALVSGERQRLAASGARSIVNQVFMAGFFPADSHRGNIFGATDGRLCFPNWGSPGISPGGSQRAR